MRSLLLFLLFLVMSSALHAQTPQIVPGVSLELAKWRAARYSDVRYKLNLTLEKMSPVLKGTIEVRVNLKSSPPYEGGVDAVLGGRGGSPLVLDWRKIRGHEDKSTISNVSINGVSLSQIRPDGPDVMIPSFAEINEHLIFRDGVVAGENVIKLDFTSPILTSGSAITRYVDKEDGAEYIYSLLVPSDASTAFPVFDQPDLKARFKVGFLSPPEDWKIVTNSPGFCIDGAEPYGIVCSYEETKPISTYVFAFAAGPWEKVEAPGGNPSGSEGAPKTTGAPNGTLPTGRVSASLPDGSIYVRKSQAAKFKPHAAEVFRLNREAVKYFEQYFDYKFPFPKYDLVLIPEFPFGGMEHAGATFLRESSIIFPQEPTKNDLVSRATLIFHEAAHQWFGDTVTMRWFDDLWLKEGFATFTAYKAMEKIMPEMNAWKVFYERIKQGAYQTDSTRGTTAIYQPIANLSAAKSAYGNIVYNKAPAFLRQAEFYLGEDKFQAAVRAFLKKHEFKNAEWKDLVIEFGRASSDDSLGNWARTWVTEKGVPVIKIVAYSDEGDGPPSRLHGSYWYLVSQRSSSQQRLPRQKFRALVKEANDSGVVGETSTCISLAGPDPSKSVCTLPFPEIGKAEMFPELPDLIFPNHGDYGYGIFLLDEKSRDYVLKNIQNEKDPFLRSMMWGALWDSVRESEMDPQVYVRLVVKILGSPAYRRPPQDDESTIAFLLSRVGTATNYYLPLPPTQTERPPNLRPGEGVGSNDINLGVEFMLMGEMQREGSSLGRRLTFYRAFLNIASSENARAYLKQILAGDTNGRVDEIPLKTKDKFDIVTRLLILNDPEAPKLLAGLEKSETGDDAKRYAYAARAGIGTAENKAKYWNDFVNNKEISESWIEAAFGPWNSIRHSDLTLPYLQKALKELPNHKRNRKIFFVNGWLGAFIGGQRSSDALGVVNKFLADNPGLDNDLRLKILENVDVIERAVRIRGKY